MKTLLEVFRAHMPVRVRRIRNRFLRGAAGVLVSPVVYARDFRYINYELRGKRVLYYVEVFLTPRCSLRCTYCAACMPSYTERYDIPFETVEASLRAFLDNIDFIENLRLLGGEPFVYPDLDRVVAYLRTRRDKIGNIRIVTNGTIVPQTERLLSALNRHTGVDHKSITAYMMGEHGALQFAPWSCVSFRGMPLDEWAKTDERFNFDRDEMRKEAIGGGWVTFKGKHCTEYGIATTAARMAHVVLHDEKQIMPASMELCGEYGESGLFVGVPCLIGKDGVEKVIELPLTEAERATFHECCEGVRKNMEHLKDIH